MKDARIGEKQRGSSGKLGQWDTVFLGEVVVSESTGDATIKAALDTLAHQVSTFSSVRPRDCYHAPGTSTTTLVLP